MNDRELLNNIALMSNSELFNENKITYKMFKYTEDKLIKEINICKENKNEFI